MKTVPTVVASTSAVAASALGLVFVRQDTDLLQLPPPAQKPAGRRSASAPLLEMTATATYTLQHTDVYASPQSFTFSTLSPFDRSSHDPRNSQDVSLSAGAGARALKRSLHARESTPMSMTSQKQDLDETTDIPQARTSSSSWLKRLSTFSSYEGSLLSSPRPPSTVISQSNGSVTFSNAGSTAPIFPPFAPAPTPPNKLVKRNSSLKELKGSSRIPLPTFKKPATSYERDASLQGLQRRPSTADSSVPLDSPDPERSTTFRSLFTPRLTLDDFSPVSKRRSTHIPNPIKRITPERRHHPLLVSSRENISPASICFGPSRDEDPLPRFESKRNSITLQATRRFFSSPLPQRPSTASSSASISTRPRSKGDELLSDHSMKRDSQFSLGKIDEPVDGSNSPCAQTFTSTPVPVSALPKWKRPPKVRGPENKYRRKGERNVSEPQPLNGISSSPMAGDTERPTKRREISGASHRSLHSSRDDSIRSVKTPLQQTTGNRSPPTGQVKTLQAFGQDESAGHGPFPDNSAMARHSKPMPAALSASTQSHAPRLSATASEFASSAAESDSDLRFHDDDYESVNENLFDSVRTRATSASSTGFKGQRIDALFDHENLMDSGNHVMRMSQNTFDGPRHSIIEEEETVATPSRSIMRSSTSDSPLRLNLCTTSPEPFPSSPPEMPTILRASAANNAEHQFNDEDWDFGGEQATGADWPQAARVGFSDLTFDRLHPNLNWSDPHRPLTPAKPAVDQHNEAKSNIFDWSEQAVDKSPAGHSPPRPRNVHGKKDAENRGSRPAGRRAPSALHIRSQSVPVAPETENKRTQTTNKFGTWGVGSKGVTEDWNEDFDFEEPSSPVPANNGEQRVVSSGMKVPQTIQEQQNNVLANINLLRDWGLLIEELKDLRGRAQALSLNTSDKDLAMWSEVDGMIDLADQESNDHTLAPRQSPPSSPTFDYGAFDDAKQMRNSPRHNPRVHAEDIIFESPTPSPIRKLQTNVDRPSPGRPRKDSEAVARSVIEALQQRRNVSDPTTNSSGPPKKVPFDTATLRRIVPYVHELRDKVKKSIRDAEALYSSPKPGGRDGSPLSHIFRGPQTAAPDSPSAQRRGPAKRERAGEDGSSQSPAEDMSRRLELLTVG